MNTDKHDKEPQNAKLSFLVQKTVSVPLAQVWEILGDFGTEHRWTKTLLHCERDSRDVHVGTARTCTLPKPLMGRTKVREELTEFTPSEAFAYQLDGSAGPFLTAGSRWATQTNAEGQTVITVEGRFVPKGRIVCMALWPLLRPFLARLTKRVLDELESFLLENQASKSASA